MTNLARRVAALETDCGASGVVAVLLHVSETQAEAVAAHVADGGADPAAAETVVFVRKPFVRPTIQ